MSDSRFTNFGKGQSNSQPSKDIKIEASVNHVPDCNVDSELPGKCKELNILLIGVVIWEAYFAK